MRQLLTALGIIWAAPYSMMGLTIGLVGLCTGGRVKRHGIVLEFHGGAVQWVVAHLPTGPLTMAITLGHTILGQTEAGLDIARTHELVHVRQFALWGPFMGPAYLLASGFMFLIGKRAYLDNPFEVQAYAVDDPCGRRNGASSRGDEENLA